MGKNHNDEETKIDFESQDELLGEAEDETESESKFEDVENSGIEVLGGLDMKTSEREALNKQLEPVIQGGDDETIVVEVPKKRSESKSSSSSIEGDEESIVVDAPKQRAKGKSTKSKPSSSSIEGDEEAIVIDAPNRRAKQRAKSKSTKSKPSSSSICDDEETVITNAPKRRSETHHLDEEDDKTMQRLELHHLDEEDDKTMRIGTSNLPASEDDKTMRIGTSNLPASEDDKTMRIRTSNKEFEDKFSPSLDKKNEDLFSIPKLGQSNKNLRSKDLNINLEEHLKSADYAEVIQSRVVVLEEEVRELRQENERLASAGQHFKDLSDKFKIKIKHLESDLQNIKEISYEEKNILTRSVEAKDIRINSLQERLLNLEQQQGSQIEHIRVRERELENRLELMKSENEVLFYNKDGMILDLKKQMNMLNIDIERYKSQHQVMTSQMDTKENLIRRTVKALRVALTMLEGRELEEEE